MADFDFRHPIDSIWNLFSDPKPAPAPVSVPFVDSPPPAPAAPQVTAPPSTDWANPWTEPGTATATVHKPAARAPGEKESVTYLGLNDASREREKRVFDGMGTATVLTGSGTDKSMQGKTLAADGKTVLDLGKESDVQRMLAESGVGSVRVGEDGKPLETPEQAKQRMVAMENTFLGQKGEDGARHGGLDVGVRDEMAGFVQHLQKVEQGDATMDRLVMSGHSTGGWVYSEADGNPGLQFPQMAEIMQQFPQAQAGVKDLMFSACHTLEKGAPDGDTSSGQQYKDMFPNLGSVWGYNGYSPRWDQGSPEHIKNWIKASEGDDASKVVSAAKRTGQNATGRAL